MKIYTKTGDHGTTSLFGGKRVSKDDLRIDAYGNVDELNSLIGTIIADLNYSSSERSESRSSLRSNSPLFVQTQGKQGRIVKVLTRIQEELLVLGSDLSSPLEVKTKIPRVTKVFITRLEREIDEWDKKLPKLKNFILPGGSPTSAKLHLARSTARRAERFVVRLTNAEEINKNAAIYINRLSDWFFVLARYVNVQDNAKETIWRGRGR